jgi:hypothetical protein
LAHAILDPSGDGEAFAHKKIGIQSGPGTGATVDGLRKRESSPDRITIGGVCPRS